MNDASLFSSTLAIIMAGSVKLFAVLRDFYRMMGLSPPQTNSLNSKNLFFFLSSTTGFFSIVAFFLFKANSVQEYVNSFHTSVTTLLFLLYFTAIARQMTNATQLIQQFEEFIEKSKWKTKKQQFFLFFLNTNSFFFYFQGTEVSADSKAKYSQLNDRIERMSKIVNFATIKLSLFGFMVPALFVTLANYFIYDLSDDSFRLPSPMMWVLIFAPLRGVLWPIYYLKSKIKTNFIFAAFWASGYHSIGKHHLAIWLHFLSNVHHYFRFLVVLLPPYPILLERVG